MKRLFMVSYVYRKDQIRALIRAENTLDIKEKLLRYHMETHEETLKIKNIREYEESQQFIHVWYCDR